MAAESSHSDVLVVGGGLSGLAAAAYLGRSGLSVRLVEKAAALGGRAATDRAGGFARNRGAHALYRTGEGMSVLKELGVPTPGKKAPTSGSKALSSGELFQLPVDTLSLLTTGLLGLAAKAAAAGWLARLPKVEAAGIAGMSVTEWLAKNLPPEARALGEAVVRVSTYANDPDRFSAGTAVLQIQRALPGVLYVDGGWQTLVDGLRARAEAAGASVEPGVRVESFVRDEAGAYRTTLRGGRTVTSNAVVLAVAPKDAVTLIRRAGGSVPRGLEHVTPLRAATLDVSLDALPQGHEGFILGIDRPLYLSIHSRVAALAPPGGALVHVMKYLSPADSDGDPDSDRAELESLLDMSVPRWRAHLVDAQYLPRMIAAERLDLASEDGIAGRPDVLVPSLPNVGLAGDWVRGGGWIADAALGSARAVARALAETVTPRRAVA